MLLTSQRWDAGVRSSHTVASEVSVWRRDAPVLVDGAPLVLSVLSGSIRGDATSKVRRVLTLTCADVHLLPRDASDLLAMDADLVVRTGIRYAQGDVELLPAGRFRLTRTERDSLLSGLSISAGDYSAELARSRFVAPWNIGRGASVTGEIAAMCRQVLPWVEVVDLTGSGKRHPGGVAFERERWDAMCALADGIGADLGFDADGRLIIAPMPTIKAEPDWTADQGLPDSVLLDLGVSVDSEGVFNAVTATSSKPDSPPISATAYQTDGPMAWRDGFKHPRFFASPLIDTLSEASAVAATVLARSMTFAQELSPAVAPNPALDFGDTIMVPHEARPGEWVEDLRLLSGFTLGITPGDMGQGMPLSVQAATTALPDGEVA